MTKIKNIMSIIMIVLQLLFLPLFTGLGIYALITQAPAYIIALTFAAAMSMLPWAIARAWAFVWAEYLDALTKE